ncbi:glycogen debranching protein GlgX [Burkholderia cepacia]|uniref:glycogen debranching protein GlgX n=1 Tax=Burkholderia cepacia TaxID=292 RepID=UPI00249F3603|nr:glycogen debranching protein GlgX [Burkholderia cepacia]WGY73531.1 glycogen debranching protein GlgX [Burkholderia cepacia]
MKATKRLMRGASYPLGAHWDGQGVNFALVSPAADAVTLCLFDDEGRRELARLALPGCENGVWHGYLDGARPGLIYGYRVEGPYAPEGGQRFNSAKVLLDPYARRVVGRYTGQESFNGHRADARHLPDPIDNAADALKAQVVHEPYDWCGDAPPRVPLADTVLCELHVKGYTQLHPDVPDALRGSLAGLAQPAVLDRLQRLGVTTLSLLPVHHRADEARLQALGLSNYWGYSSIGFFAPEARYGSGRHGTTPLGEFRDLVRALHARGLELVLDVVYNHTAETDEAGPTLSFRGIDNALYYHLCPGDSARYENWTGCGNTLDLSRPRVLQLVMDSLRYWVEEAHVDGFRFDLAPVLARDAKGFSATAAFLAALAQDPVLSRVKLIAEPWDLGPGGYRLGHFPAGWLEWNDQYRKVMRGFWLRRERSLGDFARRFAGSSDVFRRDGRQPAASVNFITAHDGFTLRDLVSYNRKHNEANGEGNRDGHHDNLSWNCGAEGDTDDPGINRLRLQLRRALLATLLFSQGTPMLLAGDEIGHSQLGNNNAYCQDNAVCWLDWAHADRALAEYTGRLLALRKRYLSARHARWYDGTAGAAGWADIEWLAPGGDAPTEAEWNDPHNACVGIRFSGALASGEGGCLLLFNAHAHDIEFKVPSGAWRVVLNSAEPDAPPETIRVRLAVPARGVLMAVEEGPPPR